jgi:hypothetical protein
MTSALAFVALGAGRSSSEMIRYRINLLVAPLETGNSRNPTGPPMEDLDGV